MAQWLRFHPSNAGGLGLIPGWGTKILHALQHGQMIFFFKFFKEVGEAENLPSLQNAG